MGENFSANSDVSYLSPEDMIREGYLQEANRQFFHPLGLALEIYTEVDTPRALLRVWDYRDDPEGIIYAQMDVAAAEEKYSRTAVQFYRIKDTRTRKFGWMIQPVDEMGMDIPLDKVSDDTA